ncbi:hypothetical protein CEXT_697111 [Caerostris extrusa]|uniref:Uncharacterized protein n=1 Tax=Caerostris extrusa TaxID=172846 RepID=A0AAV4UQV6_CAEEX|nr:hypothetical protein CEXT_697111 [Caerostris extrusa]
MPVPPEACEHTNPKSEITQVHRDTSSTFLVPSYGGETSACVKKGHPCMKCGRPHTTREAHFPGVNPGVFQPQIIPTPVLKLRKEWLRGGA